MKQPTEMFLRLTNRMHADLSDARRSLRHAAAMAERAAKEEAPSDTAAMKLEGIAEVARRLAESAAELADR